MIYLGAIRDVCISVLERVLELIFNSDVYTGYNPERIKLGNASHKVVQGIDEARLWHINSLK